MNQSKIIDYLQDHYFEDKQTLFPIILILNSLNSCSFQQARSLKKSIANLLVQEKSSNQLFNYWFRNSVNYVKEPYPDDLDDSFCAWSALINFNRYLLEDGVLLQLSKILVLNQQQTTGPYFTWFVNKNDLTKWKNLDLVVNINIARFLATLRVSIKGLNDFIDEKIGNNEFSSVFYKDELASLYFLSYFYCGSMKNKVKEKIIFHLKQDFKDNSVILLFIAAIRFGWKNLLSQKHLRMIDDMLCIDGSIDAFDFYKYKNKITKKDYYANRVLSTAFYLELISLLDLAKQKHQKQTKQEKLCIYIQQKITGLYEPKVQETILQKAQTIIFNKQSDLALFLPYELVSSLQNKVLVKDQILLSLTVINLWAWLAYTIYDHFNDLENDAQETLPIANLAFQMLIREVYLLPDSKFYLNKILNLFSIMEQNSLKEINVYRFKKDPWDQIALIKGAELANFSYQKSIGQIFSVYFLLKYYQLPERKAILSVLRYLLIVKQMNDDAHDCFKDLSFGQINSANYLLLKLIATRKDRDELLSSKIDDLKIIYYQQIIPVFSKKILNYIQKTKYLLSKQHLLKKDNFFKLILSNYETIVEKGLQERQDLDDAFTNFRKESASF